MKYCLVIPHYNHAASFSQFLPKLEALALPCIIVDDGSEASQRQQVQEQLQGKENFHFIAHPQNRGKGAAFFSGCYHARTLGFSHVIQIDADGQHDTADIETFIRYSQQHPQTIISGKPYFAEDAPKIRVYGRRVTDIWTALETLSFKIKDGLCGFRLYPLSQVEQILDKHHVAARMDFDTDILVKALWQDIDLHFIPTKVIYLENGVSHFHYLRDNKRLILLHSRLILGMLLRSPLLLARKIKKLLASP